MMYVVPNVIIPPTHPPTPYPPCVSLSMYDEMRKLEIAWWWHDERDMMYVVPNVIIPPPYPPCVSLSMYDEMRKLEIEWW